MAELLACAHLMAMGWHVYRCESPAAPFDLAAYRDGELLRVEVKTISARKKDTYVPPFGWPKNDEWDLFLLVGLGAVLEFRPGVGRAEVRAAVAAVAGTPFTDAPALMTQILEIVTSMPDDTWTAASTLLELRRRGPVQVLSGQPQAVVSRCLLELAHRGEIARGRRGSFQALPAADRESA